MESIVMHLKLSSFKFSDETHFVTLDHSGNIQIFYLKLKEEVKMLLYSLLDHLITF